MPKIIDGLKEKILLAARNRLLSGEASELSLRGVASDCGIAVGTIYNYYKDKENLIAAVMAEDWIAMLGRSREEILKAESFESGLLSVYKAVRDFSRMYEGIWQSYPTGSGFGSHYRARHGMLLDQIRGEISLLTAQLGVEISESRRTLLAELIIAASQHPEISEEELLGFISKS
ncbi:MAG: TetR/AcrR family transcriptional regulator [Firmicutes bacterium]|nr:TetR/AcrR family transcriptional regulator [Bacillota bacterium]